MNRSEHNNLRERIYGSYSSWKMASSEGVSKRMPYFKSFAKKYIPQNKNIKILDLGCGKGDLLQFLRQLGYREVSGMEKDIEAVSEAGCDEKHMITQCDLITGISKLPNASIDVVICFDVVEHLTRSELLELAQQVFHILSEDGIWIIHTANAGGIFSNKILYSDLTHEQAFTYNSILQLANIYGFHCVSVDEDWPVVHGFKSLIRYCLWALLRSLWLFAHLAETGNVKNVILSQNLLAVLSKSKLTNRTFQ